MLKLLVIASVAVVALGQGRYGGGGYGGGGHGGGGGGGYGGGGYGGGGGGGGGYGGGHDYAQPTPYEYGYEIQGGDHHSDFKQSRKEHSDGHGNVQGSYGYTDSHGNQRYVDYVADHHGFRAKVRTNEPGTDNQHPADVELHADPPKQSYGSGGGYGGGGSGGYGGGGYGGGSQGGYGRSHGGY